MLMQMTSPCSLGSEQLEKLVHNRMKVVIWFAAPTCNFSIYIYSWILGTCWTCVCVCVCARAFYSIVATTATAFFYVVFIYLYQTKQWWNNAATVDVFI